MTRDIQGPAGLDVDAGDFRVLERANGRWPMLMADLLAVAVASNLNINEFQHVKSCQEWRVKTEEIVEKRGRHADPDAGERRKKTIRFRPSIFIAVND